ncbi:hypothetical protein C8F04DRAFT_1002906 [Mycena alexandri]|uniref:rRNA-processing protein EFG1 n=1 Tax=Mycena alexandri TaxID=1745969 RepID=A0AAD6WZM9_9AGAR|nr:hypothetical protein C8F04DRAFT_1002906 [Mycena alexandri]
MGPVRTKKARIESNDAPVAGPSKAKAKRPKTAQESSNGTPGVQKLKASLRQTRRLLAKDTLAADVRVETERRLKALEADLEVAELGKKERTLAVRYHKVKFFERQKVVRKLNQTKKKISASETPELQSALQELRVDLNYILHYPKTKKYISLFPPELRKGETQEPSLDAGREEVRAWVRSQMDGGEISAEPELHLDSRGGGGGADWGGDEKKKKKKTKKGDEETRPEEDDQPEDAFFGDDDEDEDES